MVATRLAPLICFVWLLGCPDGSGPVTPCNDEGSPTLTIGTGEDEFMDISTDNPAIELIHGPQGGYHLLLGFQLTNMDGNHCINVEATGSVNDEVIASAGRWLSFSCNETSERLEAANLFLIYDAEPEALYDQLTDIEVMLRDNDGVEVEGSIQVRISAPE